MAFYFYGKEIKNEEEQQLIVESLQKNEIDAILRLTDDTRLTTIPLKEVLSNFSFDKFKEYVFSFEMIEICENTKAF